MIKPMMMLSLFGVLSACGGGGGDPEPQPPAPPFEVQASALKYSQQARFTLTGTDLAKLDKASISNCQGLTLAESTDMQKVITCTVSATGEIKVDLKDAQDAVLASRSFSVPEPQVRMTTSLGTLVVELNPSAAPVTVSNFMRYVNDDFYANTLFHRVIAGFVVQGGWLTPEAQPKPGQRDPIALESKNGLPNLRGTVAMARTSEPNSATSQFFFNLVDNARLNYVSDASPGYAVFGKVVQGLEVMDAMAAVQTGSRFGLSDVPQTDLVLIKAEQIQ